MDILILLIIIVLVFTAFVIAHKFRMIQFKPIAKKYGLSTNTDSSNTITMQGIIQNKSVTFIFKAAERTIPANMEIIIEVAQKFNFSLTQRDEYSSVLTEISGEPEMNSGDKKLDKSFIIHAKKNEELKAALQDDVIIKTIQDIFNCGFKSIEVYPKTIEVNRNFKESELFVEHIEAIVELIIQLGTLLADFSETDTINLSELLN